MDDNELNFKIDKPLKLEPHQIWICNYLDRLNEKEKICSKDILPSDLIKGALAAILYKDTNPDWMAQSAHSYREILYKLGDKDPGFIFHAKFKFYFWYNKFCHKFKIKNKKAGEKINELTTLRSKKKNLEDVLQILHEQERAHVIADTLYKTHLAFTKISHHFLLNNNKKETINIFKKLGIEIREDEKSKFPSPHHFNLLVRVFENTLKESSLDPLEVHKKIDCFIAENKKDDPYLRLLFSLNYDAKRYFFFKADEFCLSWLRQKGFLDEIWKKGDHRLPELDYLTRMAEKDPVEIAKIINSVKISEANFNPEVIYRFLWIIGKLPAEQIKMLTKKIYEEQWVYLMRKFNQSGYEYSEIVEKLVKNKESSELLEVAQAIFIIKSKEDVAEKNVSFGTDDPFYIHDIHASGIFEAIVNIEGIYAEQALKITADAMGKIVKLAGADELKIFDYEDNFSLYDVDFFALELNEGKRSSSYREAVKSLAAVIKKLIEKTIGVNCGNTEAAKKLFTDYIVNLPTSRSMWRLKLFALSRCPEVFKQELRDAFFKLFEVENYYEIEGGTEYKKALRIGFPLLSDKDQRNYVAKVLQYFSEKAKQNPGESWHKRTGWEILSSIYNCLKDNEPADCEKNFGNKCDEKFEPVPLVSGGQAGFISHKSPVNLDSFTIEKIIANLKSEWTPEKFNEQFKNDDFLNPRGAEGLGDALKEDIKKRTDDYLKNINSFLDRSAIHSYYLYSLLRGIEEMLRNKQLLNLAQIGQIFSLFEAIKNEGEKTPFKKKDDKSWLADWIAIHKVITDILLYILENKELRESVFREHREKIKNFISYLFTIKDSPSKEDEKPEYGEPYGVAINSVRGRAFEVFVVFTENDGKILAEDTKELYRVTLSDDSLAVRFVIGRYLASFYFRDAAYIEGLFPEIFPKDDPNKKDIYLATWEGYLSNTLYDKLFEALKVYYGHAITLDSKDYTPRKYFKGLDESLAIHLALAFAHLGLEIQDDLFKQFWAKKNIIRHKEFISFIGQSCITRDQAGDEWLEKNKVSKEKLFKFWDWALGNITDQEVLSGFGYWINYKKEILNDMDVISKLADTLKKSDGDVEWSYGFLERLPIFAEKNGEKTLQIIHSYLLDSKNNINHNRHVPLLHDDKIKESLRIIYKNGDVALGQKVTDLINTLIEKGSSAFWELKEVIV